MKLKIGIVGFGDIGKMHYNELRRSTNFEVCGIFGKEKTQAPCRTEVYDDFKEFIQQSEPQALIICLEQSELFKAFFECVKYTKSILISSPTCLNIDELRQMRYIANANKNRCAVSFLNRFDPVVYSLKKALNKEEEIYSVEIFHSKLNASCDAINELSIYDLILARDLSNNEIVNFNYNPKNIKKVKDIHISFTSKKGVLFSLISSTSSSVERFSICVNAKNGIYFANINNSKLHEIKEDGQINLKVDNEKNKLIELHDNFYNLCKKDEYNNLVNFEDLIKLKELFI